MTNSFPESTMVYETDLGRQLLGDSRELLASFQDDSIDLILTSPPFALLRKKSYGNEDQSQYVEWLMEFGRAAMRPLKPTGSFVLDLGGAYQSQRPIRSLYNYRVLLQFCDALGYRLAEEFFWHNPAKLPSPIEWVNKRKIRAKDTVNTVWWLAKGDYPKADVRKVLVPYSDRMKSLLKDPERFYRPKERPSGHQIGRGFGEDRGGALPGNLLQIPNTDSNSHYLRLCKVLGAETHPARFPLDLPRFFIKMLTDPGDMVVDIFSGSNTTGFAADQLGRCWTSIEVNSHYAALSAVRFMDGWNDRAVKEMVVRIEAGDRPNLDRVAAVAGRLLRDS